MRASREHLRQRTGQRNGRGVRRTVAAAVLAGAMALTSACTGGGNGPSWQGGGQPDDKPKATAAITGPAADAKDVPASAEIEFTTEGATDPKVELTDAGGKAVEGALTTGGTSWLPSGQLDYATTYTATVTATDADGKPVTASQTFTTMAKPANQVRVTSFIGDNQVVGIAMPLVIRFSRAVPEDFRDDVQRRMSVRATPAQEGVWNWTSPTEVRYRPKEYWQANTVLSYKVQAGGLPMGDGWYGRADLTIDAKVGPAVEMVVDNASKQMTVTKDGAVIKTIPISLGKQSTPSSSGTMVVMEKLRETVFDTFEELGPEEGYRTDIEYAQRLTWGGEFIHAAPWSVNDQGRRNVSHGCVNMSTANAAWLFGQTKVGDPITVKGTERKLANGNGWTDWNVSWDDYVKGSALPYQPADAPTTPTAEPTASGN